VPISVTDLTPAGKADYNLDWAGYLHDDRKCDKIAASVTALQSWVLATVSTDFQMSCCPENSTLDVWYRALELSGASYQRNRVADVRERYQRAVKPLTKAPRNFEAWVTEWESAVAEAKSVGVGETREAISWAPDLAKALGNIKPVWTENFTTNNRLAIESNTISYVQVAGDLRYNWKTNYQARGTVSKGAFPTFGAGAQEDEQLEAQPEPSKSPKASKKSKKEKAKRKRAETTGPNSNSSNGKNCRACFGPHNLSECYYAIDGKAPETWRPNQSLRRFVDERIDQDIALSEEIKRLTKAKAEGSTYNS